MDIHKKDLLFYSNFCEHCNNLVNMMIKKNVRDSFILVCVDKRDLKIPGFVDRVPTILTAKKEIYTDDSLYKYVDSKIVKHNPSFYAPRLIKLISIHIYYTGWRQL